MKPNIENNWVLHHDNVPCHITISVNELLAYKSTSVVPQLSYPYDFFPGFKNHLKEYHFGKLRTVQTAATEQLKAIPVSCTYYLY